MPVQQAAGEGPVRMAVGEGEQDHAVVGATGDAAGGNRLARTAAQMKAGQSGANGTFGFPAAPSVWYATTLGRGKPLEKYSCYQRHLSIVKWDNITNIIRCKSALHINNAVYLEICKF